MQKVYALLKESHELKIREDQWIRVVGEFGRNMEACAWIRRGLRGISASGASGGYNTEPGISGGGDNQRGAQPTRRHRGNGGKTIRIIAKIES